MFLINSSYNGLLGLGPDLYDAGYTNITHIDTSMVVINQMNDRYFDREEMECKIREEYMI